MKLKPEPHTWWWLLKHFRRECSPYCLRCLEERNWGWHGESTKKGGRKAP